MNALWVTLLLIGNAFFVAAEFALVASKRHRLEQSAANGSRAAKAALDGTRELSVMLAGAQLGITLCSLGLGALAEPSLEHLFGPALHAIGLPDVASHVIAFLLALIIVTFLHLVIGEMMPKSWAITHPERSAILLALPFRMYARIVGPALRVLNALANLALKPFGVHPQDQLAQAHGPAEMRILLDRSRAEGLIEAEQSELLTSVLSLASLPVRDVMLPTAQLVSLPEAASVADIELASLTSGRARIAVTDEDGRVVGVVHVREAVRASATGRAATAGELMEPAYLLDAGVNVVEAVAALRAGRTQLAIVTGDDAAQVGFVALEDLLEQVIGRFDDETDDLPATANA
ncbi:HlyC/CorC family transporter [Actinoplanes sp. LDG1-06]|uniref:HlyC/CorC family transporter n=1 Tax=Paractinoplanes ovalisporus TaxID=2810368 RepID=A0ABS2AD11_9ACTN|nr:hemolysin family protein [Actinoplanes ovalisporus]MBM2617717.1 HlyC/CorC family transporter [Actinoplanes ovalisporus]